MFLAGAILAIVLFAIGSPIFVAFSLGASFIGLYAYGLPIQSIASLATHSITSYTMLAIPLFVLMGDIFLRAGASESLINLIRALLGRLPGGLGIAMIIACAFFGALCGSANATIAAIGAIMIPAMLALEYDEGTATGALASAGSLGNLIPPSIFFILYGALEHVNIATLFMAGILPGIITACMLAFTFLLIARKKHFPTSPPSEGKVGRDTFIKALPSLIMPLIVLGGIYSGIFTPTEAASVACVYSLFLGFVIYRKLTLRTLWEGVIRSVMMIGNIYLIVMGAMLLGKVFALAGWPQAFAEWAVEAGLSPLTFLALAAFVMVTLGIFVEAIAMMFLTLPILFPAAIKLGISPIHFGVFVVLSMMVGQCTPPMASSIYVASIVTRVPAHSIARGITPFTITLIIALVIMILFPELSLWVPKLMGMGVLD